MAALTKPPTFTDVDEERAYLKERLCAAMRIFAAEKFDHGVVSLVWSAQVYWRGLGM